jgi:hypothetical protein
MALILKTDTAMMAWKTSGALAGVHMGTRYALLHCTNGANLGAGDTEPAGEVVSAEPVEIVASMVVEATNAEKDLGTRQIGLAQVTALNAYEFLYVGRVPTEGSTLINMKSGFPGVASLDSKKGKLSIDDRIFAKTNIDILPPPSGTKGFTVNVTMTDHPHNAVPLQFENRVAGVQNYLARILRNQHFIVYFMTRETPTSPITILGRLGWAVHWDTDVNWSAKTNAPVKPKLRASHLFPGEFRIGAPPDGDPWAKIALDRTEPTTNALDEKAADDAWDLRKSPMCEQSKTRPDGFRDGFYT